MSVTRIASRYAKSLLDLAVESNKVDAVVKDMTYFGEAVKNRDLHLLIKSPIITGSKKEQIFKTLFGDKFDDLTQKFFSIAIRKGREQYLTDIAEAFDAQYKQMKGITEVVLTTAVPMEEAALSAVKEQLTKSSQTAQAVDLETEVNPDIIGGFVLKIGDKLYDASVAQKLKNLKKEISNNDYISKL